MRLLFIFLLLPFFVNAQRGIRLITSNSTYAPPVANDFYVSTAGVGADCTIGAPCSLATFLTKQISTGDRILFNKGDTFDFGQYVIPSASNIDILSYGTGANPIIRGSTDVGAQTFTDNADGTWYTSLTTAPKWVIEGDVMLRLAESAYIPITVSVSSTVKRVTIATITALPYTIVGSTIVAKEYPFRLTYSSTVTAFDSGTGNITFTPAISGSAAGMPILLRNQKQFMTLDADWFYDDALDRLYIKSVSTPNGRNIRVINNDYGIKINGCTDVTIDGLELKHYFLYPISIVNSGDVTVQNSRVHVSRDKGIYLEGFPTTNTIIDNVEIDNIGLVGIEFGQSQGQTIQNSEIHDIGLQANLGYPVIGSRTGGTAVNPSDIIHDVVINKNEMYNLGYSAVEIFGINWRVTNNHFHDFCKTYSDGGAVHLYWVSSLTESTSGNLIQNNYIHDSTPVNDGITVGASTTVPGIYFDAGINNNTIDKNIVHDTGIYNIYCNFWNTGHIITNNIVIADNNGITIQQNTTPNAVYPYTTVSNCVLTGNILASNNSAARGVSIISWNGLTTFNPFSSVNNNHYVNPYATSVNRRSSNGSIFTSMTLSDWQTYIAGDGNGTTYVNWKGGAPDADDILLETNLTDASVNFNTPAGYKDYTGTIFTNPVAIPARYGLPYFQN